VPGDVSLETASGAAFGDIGLAFELVPQAEDVKKMNLFT
jgi:hypothetical protein